MLELWILLILMNDQNFFFPCENSCFIIKMKFVFPFNLFRFGLEGPIYYKSKSHIEPHLHKTNCFSLAWRFKNLSSWGLSPYHWVPIIVLAIVDIFWWFIENTFGSNQQTTINFEFPSTSVQTTEAQIKWLSVNTGCSVLKCERFLLYLFSFFGVFCVENGDMLINICC